MSEWCQWLLPFCDKFHSIIIIHQQTIESLSYLAWGELRPFFAVCVCCVSINLFWMSPLIVIPVTIFVCLCRKNEYIFLVRQRVGDTHTLYYGPKMRSPMFVPYGAFPFCNTSLFLGGKKGQRAWHSHTARALSRQLLFGHCAHRMNVVSNRHGCRRLISISLFICV